MPHEVQLWLGCMPFRTSAANRTLLKHSTGAGWLDGEDQTPGVQLWSLPDEVLLMDRLGDTGSARP